jgi:hypothetical protein
MTWFMLGQSYEIQHTKLLMHSSGGIAAEWDEIERLQHVRLQKLLLRVTMGPTADAVVILSCIENI